MTTRWAILTGLALFWAIAILALALTLLAMRHGAHPAAGAHFHN